MKGFALAALLFVGLCLFAYAISYAADVQWQKDLKRLDKLERDWQERWTT